MTLRTRMLRRLAGAGAVFFAISTCACSPQAERGRPSGEHLRPNIVVVVWDTVRRDHVSCFGYERETAPTLRALARSSRVYWDAYSVSSWTAPAHASLFTGLFPLEHGTTQESWVMPEELTTLAELLRDSGYLTVGISENPVVSTANGFDQGFERFHEMWRGGGDSDAPARVGTVETFRSELARVADRRPFFFFVNLIGAHNPYNSSGRFKNDFVEAAGNALDRHDPRGFYTGRVSYSEEELRHLEALYDAEIRAVDHQTEQMVAGLRHHDALEDTVLVITSDHGENIGDHGHVGHVFSLYQSTVQIPLLIRFPPLFEPGSVEHAPVQLPDLFRTLTSIAGVAASAGPGVANLADDDLRSDRPVFMEYYRPKQAFKALQAEQEMASFARFDRRLDAVVADDVKLIRGDDGSVELYDLRSDPDEKAELTSRGKGVRSKEVLQRLLDQYRDSRGGRPTGNSGSPGLDRFDDESLEALRELGYVE